jgi:signal transduction histidine kinase
LVDTRVRALELELGRATLALEDLTGGGSKPPTARINGAVVDLARLVAESVEAWRAPAAAQGAILTMVESQCRPQVWGERLRLAQAIGNLLSNAIEHGGDRIEVSYRADGANVLVEVRDDGPGLPAPVSSMIGRRQWASGRRVQRHGHGLAVASAVANAHGGRLASAPAGRGARLVLELPRGR